jgi:hypothetical protein
LARVAGRAHQHGRHAAPATRAKEKAGHGLEALDAGGRCRQDGAEVGEHDGEGGRCLVCPTLASSAFASGRSSSSTTVGTGAIGRSIQRAQRSRPNSNKVKLVFLFFFELVHIEKDCDIYSIAM